MSCQDGLKRLKMTRFEEKDLAGFISQILIKNGQIGKNPCWAQMSAVSVFFYEPAATILSTIQDSGKTKKLILAIRMAHTK
jgi:MFS-type transporter involved in bile tolerance (Atg22 family)